MTMTSPPPPTVQPREPIFNLPAVIVGLLILLGLVHAGRAVLSASRDLSIMADLAVIPARFALELGWASLSDVVRVLAQGADQEIMSGRIAALRFFIDDGGARWWTPLTYALLHADIWHLCVNMIWLAAFGSPVARRLGGTVFLMLMAVGAIAGAALHVWLHWAQVAPLIGASAAVSAAIGAAARFVFAPGVPFGALSDDAVVKALPAQGFVAMLRSRQTVAFIAIWFGSNWLFGSGVVPVAGTSGDVAWEAHVGGFLAGLLMFPLLDRIARGR
jgi:membrane associated rhomboid family serine protease